MVQIEMDKPSACRWTDEEDSIHLCPFLDSEYECILQGRIGYWSWGGQYKNCPLHEVTEDSDTISREAVINAICRKGQYYTHSLRDEEHFPVVGNVKINILGYVMGEMLDALERRTDEGD